MYMPHSVIHKQYFELFNSLGFRSEKDFFFFEDGQENSVNWVMRPPCMYLTSATELTSLAMSLFQAPKKVASTRPLCKGGVHDISCPVCPCVEPCSLGIHLPKGVEIFTVN